MFAVFEFLHEEASAASFCKHENGVLKEHTYKTTHLLERNENMLSNDIFTHF